MNEKIRLKLRQLLSIFKVDSVNFKTTYTHDNYDGIDWPHANIIINNKSIFERLKEYEIFEAQRTNSDEKLAGNYDGIDPSDLLNYFYTEGGIQIMNKRKFTFSISQCKKCYSASCTSDLYCDCKISPLTIEFLNFRQAFNPAPFDGSKKTCPENIEKHKWNYEPFGPFKFTKGEFLTNLRKEIYNDKQTLV
jgi:hypothetical protein